MFKFTPLSGCLLEKVGEIDGIKNLQVKSPFAKSPRYTILIMQQMTDLIEGDSQYLLATRLVQRLFTYSKPRPMMKHSAYLLRRLIFSFRRMIIGNAEQAKSDTIAHAAIQLFTVRGVGQDHDLTILSVPDA